MKVTHLDYCHMQKGHVYTLPECQELKNGVILADIGKGNDLSRDWHYFGI